MYLPRLRLVVLTAAVGGSLVACGPSISGDDDDEPVDAAVDGRPVDGPGGIDADETPPSRVYAHSGQMLYRIDTATGVAVPVGPFTNLGTQSMTDIAVDRDERMIGVTLNKIFEVDEATGASTFLADFTGSNLTSLSFVPVNPGNPDGPEMLVAATDTGAVIRIDVTGATASSTIIGDYGQFGGMDVISSGDALQPVATATTVRVRDGKLTTTDGPFAETREQLGGYYLIEAKDLDEAIKIAARIPSARYGSIEVRPVMAFTTD